MEKSRTNLRLEAEVKALRLRLEEAEETLRAIRHHEVDALVVDGPEGPQVFTLQGAERPYRILMETMSEGALTVATDGTILYCNSRFSELTGTPLNKLLGTSFHDLVISRNGQSFEAMLRVCGIKGSRGEFLLRTAHGGEVPVSLSARSLMLNDVEACCIVAADLTDQMHAREALEEAKGRLELQTEELRKAYDNLLSETEQRQQVEERLRQAQKVEALGTLTGGVAHDFNNILAAIIGFTELVEDHVPKGSREAHHLSRVMESSLRGRDLVRQMLTYSRKDRQEKKPLSLSNIVKETVKLIRATTPTTIDIRVDTLSESGLILADPTQIQQVLLNLCTNAAYAMRANGGILDIRVSDHSVSPSNGNPHGINPGLYTRLTVRDTGAGIPPGSKIRYSTPSSRPKNWEREPDWASRWSTVS